jgi:hypothetical protein
MLHPIFNVDLFHLYFPPLLEHTNLQLEELEDIHQNDSLAVNTTIGQQAHHTRTHKIPLFWVDKARQILTQGKWFSITKLAHKFPHLHNQAMETMAN